jgi:hypothetical protein
MRSSLDDVPEDQTVALPSSPTQERPNFDPFTSKLLMEQTGLSAEQAKEQMVRGFTPAPR